MADVTSEPKPFNPFAPGFAEDPYPQFAELSARNPVQSVLLRPEVELPLDTNPERLSEHVNAGVTAWLSR